MPPSAHTIVDPRFPAELARLRRERGLSLRQLAAAVSHGKSVIHQLETGQTRPAVDVAVRLDDALAAGGALAAMVVDVPDGGRRAAYVAAHPGRVDLAGVRILGDVLAGYRRLEDSIGAAAVLPPVRVQLDTIGSLLREAGHQVRPAVVDMAAQWAQFAGWLGIANGDDRTARVWLDRSLQWSTEASNADLTATVLSFQGHRAEGRGDLPEMIGLSRAARIDPRANTALRAYSAGQEARGLAMAGACPTDVRQMLTQAADLATEAAETPLPAWGYWYTPAFYAVQQGIVWRYLGDRDARANDRAVELLTAGTAGVDETAESADWHGRHLVHLAIAHGRAGDSGSAQRVLERARSIAVSTASRRLAGQVDAAVRDLGLSVNP
ncbi:helix-turn-helix transcriptional regulator [Verrucosispora sp. WMMA2044]|uniref:helix-turn-helix domain-containing protein n=1 Tax=Verrucosispora sp. WMMA2044 TaxID=3016419 RepID=UPI00248BBDE9|nr:helix-turn-helix transcriptional regulator [Verrucosispora sp. WMMA2044]WBB51279.1 helix-turn-helix transcriptional regulator [Verrucosispora sp. WMMA2044]